MDFQNKLPIYEAEITDDWDSGIWGVSFVSDGAVMRDFITFANQEKPIIFANEEQHDIVGVLLIPNQLIYRNDTQEYYIRWGRETICRVAEKMAMTLAYQNFTLDHSFFLGMSGERNYEDSTVSGVECKRLWVTEGKDDDLYTKYNFDPIKCPVGTLAIHCHIENEELWEKCKDGTYNAFSIEGLIEMNIKQ